MSTNEESLGLSIPFLCCGTNKRLLTEELFRGAACPTCGKKSSERALNQLTAFAMFPSDCIVEVKGIVSGNEVVVQLRRLLLKHINGKASKLGAELKAGTDFLCAQCDTLVATNVSLLSVEAASSVQLIGAAALADRALCYESLSTKQFRVVLLLTAPPFQKADQLRAGAKISFLARSFFN